MQATECVTAPRVTVIPADPVSARSQTVHRQLRVAAYCRVSSDLEEQLSSYEAQVAYYTDKIMTNPEWTLAGIFADEGKTGTSVKKRSDFLKMIRLCRNGKIDLILTKSISRFARNTVDCLSYIRALKELGIPVIFEKENINTIKSESEIYITMLGGFAQAESESISQNVRWGIRQSFNSGKVPFQYSKLYGYERGENNKPKVIPEQAAVVQRIFESYLAGCSVPGIKRMLEAKSIPAAGGKPQWSVGALQYLLRNEKYCGDAILQKTYVENCISKKIKKNNGELPKYLIQNNHVAIIDRPFFDKVQAEIARRAGKRKVSDITSKTGLSKYSGKYALTELLVCGNCGSAYKRVTWAKKSTKKIVWRCVSRLDYGTKYCKQSPTLEEGTLQKAILAAINKMMSDRDRLIGILKSNLEITLSEQNGEEIDPIVIRSRIQEQQENMSKLLAITIKAGHPEDYEDKFREISEEIQSLQKTLDQYQSRQNGEDELTRQIDDICKSLQDAPFEITEYKDSIVRQLIDTVKVMSDDKLIIIFKGGVEVKQIM